MRKVCSDRREVVEVTRGSKQSFHLHPNVESVGIPEVVGDNQQQEEEDDIEEDLANHLKHADLPKAVFAGPLQFLLTWRFVGDLPGPHGTSNWKRRK